MLLAAAAWPSLPVHPPAVCPLRSTTGLPCPLCGMTRAVVAAVRGDLAGSLRFNPAGILVVLLALAIVVLGPHLRRLRPPIPAIAAALTLLWVYNLTLNPTF
ncbi:MAG: hypothetical protein KatS3mg010_1854 [Acidimicrobiia bacterium]|nr:MAG: hypothetical protein KatS3mg010_1854 [Acidimicrobiia bacterium]